MAAAANGPSHLANGLTEPTSTFSNRVDIIDTAAGRILAVADIRGKLSSLNSYAAEHKAKAIIHSGDFGFFDASSLSRISERTLKHLVQYSNLLSPAARQTIMTAPTLDAMRQAVQKASQDQFALSEFPKLLTGELKLAVPVYTVYGACEDVAILERLRAAPLAPTSVAQSPFGAQATSGSPASPTFSVPNLTVLSEGTTRALVIGGVRLRLFGLGGALVPHKFFDNGDGQATIAGAGGTMWTTILQIGELVDTAQRVYDPTETRLLVTHASPGREGLIAQLALALKADLTISAGLHFRYGVSYNEYSVQHDAEAYRNKLLASKLAFNEVWETVKTQVDQVVDEHQRKFLDNALAVTNRLPAEPAAGQPASAVEEPAWKNAWNWNLPDANYGSLVLDVRDGRFSTEMRSQGFNFAYRAQQGAPHRGPAVKVPPSQHHAGALGAPSPPSAPGPTSATPPIVAPNAAAGAPSPAPIGKHVDERSMHAEGAGGPPMRGGRGRGAFRGGPHRPFPMPQPKREAPTSAPQATDTGASPGPAPPPPSAQTPPAPATTPSTLPVGDEGQGGGSNQAQRFEGRGRGRGRGRGEGRGDGMRGRGSFRGGRGGHPGATPPNAQGGPRNETSTKSDSPATNGPPAPASEEPPW